MTSFGDVRSACHAGDVDAVRDAMATYDDEVGIDEVVRYIKSTLGFLPPHGEGWALFDVHRRCHAQPTPQALLERSAKLTDRTAYTIVRGDWRADLNGRDLLVRRFDDLHHAMVVAMLPLLEEVVASFRGTGASEHLKACVRADMARCMALHRAFAAEPTKRHQGPLNTYRYLGAWQDSGCLLTEALTDAMKTTTAHTMPAPKTQPRKYSASWVLISPAKAPFEAWDIALETRPGTARRRIYTNLLTLTGHHP